jgi:hypothetical protein
VEDFLDAVAQLAADDPLLAGHSLDAHLEDDAGVGKVVHPHDFEGLEDKVAEGGVGFEPAADLAQGGHDPVHVFLVIHASSMT